MVISFFITIITTNFCLFDPGGGGQPNQPKCDQQCKAQIHKALNAIKTLKQSYCAFYVASQNQTDFLVKRDENNASSLLQK